MKKLRHYEEELEIEREKLNQMISKAMSTPIAKNDALIEQSRKVDALIVKVQQEKEKSDKSNVEHSR